MDYRRTHRCGDLRRSHVGESVTLSGWIHGRRDHGGVVFIDLRDRFGLTQLVFDTDMCSTTRGALSELRSEWVITAQGRVRARGEGLANPKLATGDIEVKVDRFQVLSKAKTPPLSIHDKAPETNEEFRLKFRYLDMRRGDVAQKLTMRHDAMQSTRHFFSDQGFLEINTPILARSTPEGARDYLIPSRIHPGNFYALPQSPQIFKQLLMIGGMDRYFQLASCFRDEDLRSDRQPEFTQIDVEMSFGYPEDMKEIIYAYFKHLFKTCVNHILPDTIPVMSYHDCLEHYGTDSPDLRFGMPLVRIDEVARRSTSPVFKEQLQKGGCIKALCVKEGDTISRREIDRYEEMVKSLGANGLSYMRRRGDGFHSNNAKFFSNQLQRELKHILGAEEGGLVLFVAGSESLVNRALDHLRRSIASERNLVRSNEFKFLWITDFPLFKWDAGEKRLQSTHHPFTAPHAEDIPLFSSDPLKMRSHAYDIIINGHEMGSGSQRIHDHEIQRRVFEALQLEHNAIDHKFGFLTEALQYGTPPHLGIALGFDRIMMVLTETDNMRDVIAFPKTQKANDLMLQCPSSVDPKQLVELKIKAEDQGKA